MVTVFWVPQNVAEPQRPDQFYLLK